MHPFSFSIRGSYKDGAARSSEVATKDTERPHASSESNVSGTQRKKTPGRSSSVRLSAQNRGLTTFSLIVHTPEFSTEELVLNPEFFPISKPGDIYEIYHPDKPLRRVVLQVFSNAARKGNFQVSVLQSIADLFELQARKPVEVRAVDPVNAGVEFVELSFKDQYISQSEIYRFKLHLANTATYLSKTVQLEGMRAQVKEVLLGGHLYSCGLVTERTKFIFRSRSAKFIILMQMSSEMWNFAEDGQLYFEKAVSSFMKVLFQRWTTMGCEHAVSIIFFSRCYYSADDIGTRGGCSEGAPQTTDGDFADGALHEDSSGRLYRDFYQVVVDNDTRADWEVLVVSLKTAFLRYPELIGWNAGPDDSTAPKCKSPWGRGTLSTASEGNFLEAVNLALSVYDKHHMDRDLSHTGQSIVAVTAGTGIYQAEYNLVHITKQRMVDNGIVIDLVCVSKPPAHTVPLLITSEQQDSPSETIVSSKSDTALSLSHTHPSTHDFFASFKFPSWVDIFFYETGEGTQESSSPPVSLLTSPTAVSPRDLPAPFLSEQQRRSLTSTQGRYSPPFRMELGPDIQYSLTFASDQQLTNEDHDVFASLRREKVSEWRLPPVIFSRKISKVPKVINPFRSEKLSKIFAERNRRWSHIFPRGNANAANTTREPNWTSLCEPALLPITTDYTPDAHDLGKHYKENICHVSLIPKQNIYSDNTEALFKELVMQRLAQGMQVIESKISRPTTLHGRVTKSVYHLGMRHQYHTLEFDADNQNI